MKKLKMLLFIGLGFLAISLASCDLSELTSLVTSDSEKTSYVEIVDEEETEEVLPETTADETEPQTIADTKEEKEETVTDTATEETPVVEKETESETIISTEYQLVLESLYQYEQNYEELYGYQALATDSKYGSLMQDVYQTFYEGAHNFLGSTSDYEVYTSSSFNYIILGEYEYTSSRLTDVIASAWITFIEENPLYYFTYTAYTIKTNGTGSNKTYSFCFLGGTDYAKAEDRMEANVSVLNMIDDFKEEYNNLESKDDYSVAKMIHDYICNKISYAYDGSGNASEEYWAHNILGTAQKGSGVCECYAETYLLLSYLTDLKAITVIGTSGGGGHIWNYVMIDGVWYGLDATWDDGEEISYDYFLVSSRVMNMGHSAYDSSSYGIDYQAFLPTLSDTSIDTSLDVVEEQTVTIPVYPIMIPGRGGFPRFR